MFLQSKSDNRMKESISKNSLYHKYKRIQEINTVNEVASCRFLDPFNQLVCLVAFCELPVINYLYVDK